MAYDLVVVCSFVCLLALFSNRIVELIEENYSFGVRRYYWRVRTESVTIRDFSLKI